MRVSSNVVVYSWSTNVSAKRYSSKTTLCMWMNLAFVLLISYIAKDASAAMETSYKWSGLNFVQEPSDIIVQSGFSAWLHCVVKGRPTPTIIWNKDNSPIGLVYNSNVNLLPNGTLHILSVSKYDVGEYQCAASSPSVGKIISSKGKLSITGLPKFKSLPEDLSVYEGETAHFKCSLSNHHSALIFWYKDGNKIFPDSRMTMLPSGALEIEKVRLQDSGEYYCLVTIKDNSKVSQKAILKVQEALALREPSAPKFVVEPVSVEARIRDNVTMDCAANGYPQPTITWLRDGAVIDMLDLDSRYIHYRTTKTLLITNVEEKDQGAYTCRAANKLDSDDAVASLNVLVPPKIAIKPESVIASQREEVELRCKYHGRPPPTVRWFKDGEEIKESEYFQIKSGTNLKIFGLIPEDAGMYQCFANNVAGQTQYSAQLIVVKAGNGASNSLIPDTKKEIEEMKVPSAPRHLNLVVSSNRYVTLSWHEPQFNNENIVGYSLFYKKKGSNRERVQNISASASIDDLDVYKTQVGQLSSGSTYVVRVVAHTSDGLTGSSSKEIQVVTSRDLDLPDPPQNLEAEVLSQSSIRVSWSSPVSKATPVTGFKMYYMEVGSAEEHEKPLSGTSYTLTGLDEFTDYSIWMVGINANGVGDPTHEVTAKTFSDAPSASPQNVTVESVSSQSLILRWEPPPAKMQNGIITGYKIRYKKRGNPGSTSKTTAGNRRLYALTDLEKDTAYSIKLSAMTVNGSGPSTQWLQAKTFSNDLDENTVPSQPTSLTAIPDRDFIELHWSPPASQEVMVRGYIIGWGRGIPDVFKDVVESKERSYIIKKLEPNSEYVISLRASNEVGEGPMIYEQVRTLSWKKVATSSLTPPIGLKTEVLTPFTISLQWTDTTLNRNQYIGNRGHYTVRYTTYASASSSSPKYRFKNVSDVTTLIDNLKPSTMYEFSVKAVKGLRDSPWSLVATNKTSETRPSSPPRDVTVVTILKDASKVRFNWHPPKQANGKITGYLIFYTTDPKSDWALEEVHGDSMSAILRRLTPNTLYHYKMQARNDKGFGPFSAMNNFTTLSGVAAVPPTAFPQEVTLSRNGLVIFIVGGVLGLMAIVTTIIGLAFYFKRNRRRNNTQNNLDKTTNVEIKPPDLWIHHDHLELKNLDKNRCNSPHLADIQHTGADFEPDEKNPYTSTSTLDRRTPYQSTYLPVVGGSTSSSVYSDGTLGKPAYSLLQYSANVNPDCSSPQENPYLVNNPNSSVCSSDGCSTLGKRHNPLRSFSVPAPPQSAPTTPQAKHLGGEPDSYYNQGSLLPKVSTSPLKKVLPPPSVNYLPGMSNSAGRRAYHIARVEALPEREESNEELIRGYSTEELTQEMANLEGLMKDLSAITANQFKC